jgi:hypothetical protein
VAGQALTISPEFVHELEKQVAEEFGLEIDWEAVEARQAAEAAAQAAMDAAAAAGGAPGQPAAPGGAAPAVPAAVAATAAPQVSAATVPAGFKLALSTVDEDIELLDDDELVALTRGKPNSGGPKFVRTPAGARVYGVPVGTPITRDLAERTAAHGVKGKVFGGGIKDPNAGKVGHQVLGGGPGAPAQNPGGVSNKPDPESLPKRFFTNPAEPGAVLMQYPDGSLALRDQQGNTSPRQHFDVHQFIELGWQVTVIPNTPATAAAGAPAGKAAAKPAGVTRQK